MTRTMILAAVPVALMGLAGCEPVPGTSTAGVITVPESVVALAAPYQDLTTARLRPEDGCYWYSHRGPVETTELPLRTPEGSPICARPAG